MAEPRLEVNDPLGRRLVVINKQTFSIGRRSSNDLVLIGNDISREHAEIVETNGRYIVRDRGSSGGTLLNGGAITERPLEHGDRISIGRTSGTELVFLVARRLRQRDLRRVGCRRVPAGGGVARRAARRSAAHASSMKSCCS